MSRSALLALGRQFAGGVLPKELDDGGDALPDGDLGHVRRRLDAQARDAPGHEVLEQVSVVACELDHLVLRAETKPLDHLLGVDPAVLDPAIGVRGKVGVVAEDVLGAHVGLELDQKTLAADVGVERVERLHLVELVATHVAFAKRRHPQVHESMAAAWSHKTCRKA